MRRFHTGHVGLSIDCLSRSPPATLYVWERLLHPAASDITPLHELRTIILRHASSSSTHDRAQQQQRAKAG